MIAYNSHTLVPNNYTPRFNEVERGYTGFTSSVRPSVRPSICLSVCPSVCGQNRVCSVTFTILAGYISYLHILSSNFKRCVACNVFWKIIKSEFLANFSNLWLWLCLVFTWDLIYINSMGSHGGGGGGGVFSECSCSNGLTVVLGR